jgi:hypothetical protein
MAKKRSASVWRKSPDDLIALFHAALPDDPRIERRKMFGYPCAFVGGNLFTGLHQENVIVRLAEKGSRYRDRQPGRAFVRADDRAADARVHRPAGVGPC